jgi:spermidine synthase
MDLFYKGWFTELDPFESARIINDKEQTSENVTVMNNGDGGHVAADGRRVRPESATYEQVQMGEAWPGQATSLRVDQVLFDEKSEYQQVMICKTYV